MSNSLKLRLISNNLKSQSLKRLAIALSEKLNYKVWRAKLPKVNRNSLLYGDCKNKIFQYKWFKEHQLPSLDYTTDYQEAITWVKTSPIFARLLTRSSEGKGIVVCETAGEVPMAPVYTKYKKKKKEYRIHVFKNKVVAVLEKRKRKDFNDVRDSRIRNTANGYVFCSDGVVEPPGLRDLALAAGRVTDSCFKGIDIGFNEKLNELFVIEVNSAPGIEGSNIAKYVEAICND